ncbi:unnamed protein product [Amoebophrya sp. A25]|nr:unnamed protein product [Amoebophrya sp. A25]|eukprot:GSA25T00015139001.1
MVSATSRGSVFRLRPRRGVRARFSIGKFGPDGSLEDGAGPPLEHELGSGEELVTSPLDLEGEHLDFRVKIEELLVPRQDSSTVPDGAAGSAKSGTPPGGASKQAGDALTSASFASTSGRGPQTDGAWTQVYCGLLTTEMRFVRLDEDTGEITADPDGDYTTAVGFEGYPYPPPTEMHALRSRSPSPSASSRPSPGNKSGAGGDIDVEFRASRAHLGFETLSPVKDELPLPEKVDDPPPRLHEYSLSLRAERLEDRIAELKRLKLEIATVEYMKNGGGVTREQCQDMILGTQEELFAQLAEWRETTIVPMKKLQAEQEAKSAKEFGCMDRNRCEQREAMDLLSRRLRELEFQR